MLQSIVTNRNIDERRIGALMQAIAGAEICIFYQTPDLIYRWAENLPDFLQHRWRVEGRDSDIMPVDLAERVETIKLQVLATGECTTTELRFEHKEQHIWYKLSIDAHKDALGKVIGLITTGVNVSEMRQREQVLKILLREVSHRSKNLLAIIQSIATQTARYSESTIIFLKKFQGRLQSLSHSQDLVTNSNWRGAGFFELVHLQTGPYLGTEKHRFSVVGDDPYLCPNAALHIGLALHELLINSFSFGALAQEKGTVTISCTKQSTSQSTSEDKLIIAIVWQERFDPAGVIPEDVKNCFGSAVLEKIVPAAVSGTAAYTIDNYGVFYQVNIPATQFEFNKMQSF